MYILYTFTFCLCGSTITCLNKFNCNCNLYIYLYIYICVCACTYIQVKFNHSHKKQIVWKHRPNWLFYALMLRTKLYQNPFFFTGHQNVNKPKNRAARTVYGLIFLRFYKIIVSLFSFLCQDGNKTRSNCATIGWNLSNKFQCRTLYKTQNRESNYVDHKLKEK